ncbi:MAG: type II toxin-antitoxin system HicB family antitoxin [Deltaproteobacteria bacterium]|nr:type II toxin-antitoxin system HicB family antitoxin [Deltaproteobacteria bacterium]
MLTKYIRAAMELATYEILTDDGSYYGEIPGFDGVYANAVTLEKCRDELEEVLEDWILLRVSRNLPLLGHIVLEGLDLIVDPLHY